MVFISQEAGAQTGPPESKSKDDLPPEVEQEIRESLLIHPTREAVVETLKTKPGMNKNQIRLELDVGLKVLDYHLNKLVDAGLVHRMPSAQDRENLYFADGDEGLWENPRTRIMFGREPTRHVGMYVAEHPGTESQAIADAMDLSVVTIRHHLRTLRDHNLIVSAKIAREVQYHPLNELKEWVEAHGDAFEVPWRD